jgi:hypothetical protein
MRPLLIVMLLLSGTVVGQADDTKAAPTCLVVSRTGNWLKGETYQFQAGEFPPGVKFRVELRNRHIREIHRKGGRIIFLNKDYTYRDLEEATKACKAQPTSHAAEPDGAAKM